MIIPERFTVPLYLSERLQARRALASPHPPQMVQSLPELHTYNDPTARGQTYVQHSRIVNNLAPKKFTAQSHWSENGIPENRGRARGRAFPAQTGGTHVLVPATVGASALL